jgi:hypothetical protein
MPVSAPFDDASKIAPLPQVLFENCPGAWRLQGQGLFTWSVFRVYRAALHVQGDAVGGGLGDGLGVDTGTGTGPQAAYALDLNYLRNVSAEQIVQTSIEEMRRLRGIDESRLDTWAKQLQAILPDVSLGDRLIGVFMPGKGVTFFSRDAALGHIDDPEFVPAFASVWLDEQTRAPARRAKLLGLAP